MFCLYFFFLVFGSSQPAPNWKYITRINRRFFPIAKILQHHRGDLQTRRIGRQDFSCKVAQINYYSTRVPLNCKILLQSTTSKPDIVVASIVEIPDFLHGHHHHHQNHHGHHHHQNITCPETYTRIRAQNFNTIDQMEMV